MKADTFLDQLDDAKVIEAIRNAEARTSGEVRVFVSRFKTTDPLTDARLQFPRLGMHRTLHRNGVLLFFSPSSQVFAVVGEEGIHAKAGDEFWSALTAGLSAGLKSGKVTETLVAGIRNVGLELAKHFPREHNDRDELPNKVARD